MEKKTIWQCHNPECNAQYGDYVNGCPKCSTGEPGGSYKVSILDEFHPAYMPLYRPENNMEKKYPIDDDENKLTPEQIEERKSLIDWYRNPGASTGAVWVKASQYDVSKGGVLFYRFNGPTLKSIGIGHFVGDVFYGIHSDTFPKWDWDSLYILDESGKDADGWFSVEDQLPTESGRYWCYVEEITDLGRGYFQWNCAYNQNGKLFTDKSLCNGERITHWRPLPEPPKQITWPTKHRYHSVKRSGVSTADKE